MWLATKLYIAYSAICIATAIYAAYIDQVGIVATLSVLWLLTTGIYVEFRNG
jgi:hypothetical protein